MADPNPYQALFGGLASSAGNIGGGISDLFAVSADRSKAAGDIFEAQNYDLAAKYADQEAFFTKESTAIQSMQSERQTYQSMSRPRRTLPAVASRHRAPVSTSSRSPHREALCSRPSFNGKA
jgi:hypothetical protein